MHNNTEMFIMLDVTVPIQYYDAYYHGPFNAVVSRRLETKNSPSICIFSIFTQGIFLFWT